MYKSRKAARLNRGLAIGSVLGTAGFRFFVLCLYVAFLADKCLVTFYLFVCCCCCCFYCMRANVKKEDKQWINVYARKKTLHDSGNVQVSRCFHYDVCIYLLWVLTGSLNSLGCTRPIFGYR